MLFCKYVRKNAKYTGINPFWIVHDSKWKAVKLNDSIKNHIKNWEESNV